MGYIHRPKAEALRQAVEKRKQDSGIPVLLTIQETQKCLRVSRDTLYRLFNSNELKSVRIKSRRLVRLEAIEEYLANTPEGAI